MQVTKACTIVLRSYQMLPITRVSHNSNWRNVIVVIPIRNAHPFASSQIAALMSQTVRPNRVIVIDSESDDGSPSLFQEAGCEIVWIRRDSFDHGGTRNLALTLAPEADIIIYLTQDAIPHGTRTLETLLQRFEDPAVGIAYGRQLPRGTASAIERHTRSFNYPALSAKRSLSSCRIVGIKSIFNSNSFAAYRRKALEAIGGFPQQVIMGEDQIAAGQIILAGWSVAYAADAEVVHSHAYSLLQEFQRYFDIGVFHQHNQSLLKNFARPTSEGMRLVSSEMAYLLQSAPYQIPEACVRTALKLLGYRLGRGQAYLPRGLKLRLAMHKSFFLKPAATSRINIDGRSVSVTLSRRQRGR
jgi:rhamnosyltransferase